MKATKHIVLIGFMGCGKSTVGNLLAQKLGLAYVDSDESIENLCGMTVSDIFSQKGESFFRNQEKEFCVSLAEKKPSIIATGGGMPCDDERISLLRETGILIYLNASLSALTSRLKLEREKRPLLAGLKEEELFGFVEQRIGDRAPFYRKAHLIMPNESRNPQVVVDQIIKELVKLNVLAED